MMSFYGLKLPEGQFMTDKKRYALVGTGSRAGLFVDAITNLFECSRIGGIL